MIFDHTARGSEMHRTRRSPLILLTLALAAGCADANRAAKDEALVRPVRDVGELYRMATIERKKPPAAPVDFRPFQDAAPEAYRAVVDGDVVVVWGAALSDLAPDESKDSPDEVLAYEKKVPSEGGTVLMKNRTARHMTADEFRIAPKAAAH